MVLDDDGVSQLCPLHAGDRIGDLYRKLKASQGEVVAAQAERNKAQEDREGAYTELADEFQVGAVLRRELVEARGWREHFARRLELLGDNAQLGLAAWANPSVYLEGVRDALRRMADELNDRQAAPSDDQAAPAPAPGGQEVVGKCSRCASSSVVVTEAGALCTSCVVIVVAELIRDLRKHGTHQCPSLRADHSPGVGCSAARDLDALRKSIRKIGAELGGSVAELRTAIRPV